MGETPNPADNLPNWLKLKVLPDEQMYWRDFRLSIVGVTHRNSDRTDRQKILMSCEDGEPVMLVRQPENKHDRWAIAVFRMTGEQIGWMPGGDFLLASHMDQGGKVRAKILRITGGDCPQGFQRSYGCVLEIGKWVPRPKYLNYWEEAYRIGGLLKEARRLESSSPRVAMDI
jgi:hypothetical protein